MAGDLTVLQQERDQWVARNFPGDMMTDSLLGAVEELGELAHHVLKMSQGIRGDEQHHREEIADAVADCVIFLAGIASHLSIDYGELVQSTWDRVKQRDWVNHPKDGSSS